MQCAPWTNASAPAVVRREAIFSISESVSSRARTIVSQPRSCKYSAPSRSCTAVCVEAWRGSAGYRSRKRRITAGSCNITASAPVSAMASASSISASISPSVTRVLTVTNTFVPRSWQNFTVSGRAKSSKFSALRRALKFFAPRYTASAPQRTAAVTAAKPPAGARMIGFVIKALFPPLVFPAGT